MTAVTGSGGFKVTIMFTGCGGAVVAARASTRDTTVIKRNRLPAQVGCVTCVAGSAGLQMTLVFARRR